MMLRSYKKAFAEILAGVMGGAAESLLDLIQLAPEKVAGDLAFPCFQFAKQKGINSAQFAKEIATKLEDQTFPFFEKIVAVGPYVNAFLDHGQMASEILKEIQEKKADYGRGLSKGKTVLLEGWAPNTHKSIHIGHVRNFLLSESIYRILSFSGYDVIKTCYPGDIGAHVAKRIWYYKHFSNEQFPTENLSKWVGELYTLATKKVDENPEVYKAEIGALQKALEDGDEELVKFWQETREMCLADMRKIFAELGSGNFAKWYFESTVEQEGIQIVHQLLENGIAKMSQGAVVMDLEEYGLGVFLLLKSNGASLYSTKDIALAYQKKADFPQYDMSLYVVGLEQEHHFEQLFKTLDLIGFEQEKLHHISYGLVDLAEGKMSSRAGNVILYEDFRDGLLERAEEMLATRDMEMEKKSEIARQVAFGAMKFGMLLQDSEKGITFDRQKALSFEGETGPYLQYMGARMSSLLKKAQELQFNWQGQSDFSLLNLPIEKQLLMSLASFSELVQKASQAYKPNEIARFALGLAKQFASYYHEAKMIDEEQRGLSEARLALVAGIQQVLQNALALLGIESPEVM